MNDLNSMIFMLGGRYLLHQSEVLLNQPSTAIHGFGLSCRRRGGSEPYVVKNRVWQGFFPFVVKNWPFAGFLWGRGATAQGEVRHPPPLNQRISTAKQCLTLSMKGELENGTMQAISTYDSFLPNIGLLEKPNLIKKKVCFQCLHSLYLIHWFMVDHPSQTGPLHVRVVVRGREHVAVPDKVNVEGRKERQVVVGSAGVVTYQGKPAAAVAADGIGDLR
jgi:hypothetical protein